MLSQSPGQVSHVLLTRSPLDLHQYCYWMDPARLACVRHAASVRPEPGSNSPLYYKRIFWSLISQVLCCTYFRYKGCNIPWINSWVLATCTGIDRVYLLYFAVLSFTWTVIISHYCQCHCSLTIVFSVFNVHPLKDSVNSRDKKNAIWSCQIHSHDLARGPKPASPSSALSLFRLSISMPSEVGLSAPSRRMGIQIYDSSLFPPNGFFVFFKKICPFTSNL